jgi:hypothetical protein
MFRSKKITFIVWIILFLAVLLAGCSPSASQPKVIAEARRTPVAVYPTQVPPTLKMVTVYNLTLELGVTDPESAAAEALRLTNAYNGYLVTSQNWYENGYRVVFMELAVPNAQAARLHTDLLRLGTTTAENYSTTTYDCLYCQPYAKIMLYLRGHPQVILPVIPSNRGWDPLRTLSSAFSVFLRIFGFLADVVIWAGVVGGPFVLIGWAVLRLLKYWRRKKQHHQPADPPAVPPE